MYQWHLSYQRIHTAHCAGNGWYLPKGSSRVGAQTSLDVKTSTLLLPTGRSVAPRLEARLGSDCSFAHVEPVGPSFGTGPVRSTQSAKPPTVHSDSDGEPSRHAPTGALTAPDRSVHERATSCPALCPLGLKRHPCVCLPGVPPGGAGMTTPAEAVILYSCCTSWSQASEGVRHTPSPPPRPQSDQVRLGVNEKNLVHVLEEDE